ncbi:hypothetical protein D3C79_745250 [compost metagenome]
MQLRMLASGQGHCVEALQQLIAQGHLLKPVGALLDLIIQFADLAAGRFECVLILDVQQVLVGSGGQFLEFGERLDAVLIGRHGQ